VLRTHGGNDSYFHKKSLISSANVRIFLEFALSLHLVYVDKLCHSEQREGSGYIHLMQSDSSLRSE